MNGEKLDKLRVLAKYDDWAKLHPIALHKLIEAAFSGKNETCTAKPLKEEKS